MAKPSRGKAPRGDIGVKVEGLDDLRAALRNASKADRAEWRKGHRSIAKIAERYTRAAAATMGGVQAKAAPALQASAFPDKAVLRISTSRVPFANVAFFGTLRRTGWYQSWERGKRQHPPWVGNSGWEYGDLTQGPYAVNPGLNRATPEIVRTYEQVIDDLIGRTFND